MGVSLCRLCGCGNGSAEQTDGEFIWPEGLAHYVEDHRVRLPDEFIERAERGPVADFDLDGFCRGLRPDGDVSVDLDWWEGLPQTGRPGSVTGHLPGCRQSTSAPG
ncbi:hypothetical protein [Catellatospora sp. TT07R-123]|uniref:hypothetical protein n=1 Tax=Catellatospora sp. TT07R-123 TaxID=2733863 RepID=UPI001BB40F01|nr:hypothetical protein [Catellatospora sp. TT07R-123]